MPTPPHHRPDDHLVEPMFAALHPRARAARSAAEVSGAHLESGEPGEPREPREHRTSTAGGARPPAPRATRRGCLGSAAGALGVLLLAWAVAACSDSSTGAAERAAPAPAVLDPAGLPAAVADAVAQARAAVAARPDSAEAWGDLGCVLDAHGLHAQALEAYAAARERDPRDLRWAYFRALMLAFTDAEPAAVVAAFDEALELRGDHAPVHVHHGRALLRADDAQAARAAFARALLLSPGLAAAHTGQGEAELALGRPEEAHAALERAVELAPRDAAAATGLARALRELGRGGEAAALAARAAELDGRLVVDDPLRLAEVDERAVDPATCVRRADAHVAAGELELAMAALRLAERSAPDSPAVAFRLGHCLAARGDSAGAIAAYERALAADPEFPETRLRLARLRGSVGYLVRARELYDELLADSPDDAGLLRERAELAYRLGDFPAAAADFARAHAIEPSTAPVHHNWGAALGQLGRTDEAIEHLERALELDPHTPKARDLIDLLRARAVADAAAADG